MSWYKLLSVFAVTLLLTGCSSKSWDWFFSDDEEEEQIVYEEEVETAEGDAAEDEVIYEYVYEDELTEEEIEDQRQRMRSRKDGRRLEYEDTETRSERRMKKVRGRHGDEPDGAGADGMEPQRNIIRFDYKKTMPSREGMRILERHAVYLMDNPDLIVTVEGHTDSVASAKYNERLGLERAQVVADLLEEMGVDPAQIVTVSYGEERPLRAGGSERAHAMNRRVELVY